MTRNIPALLLWDLRALSFVDNITLLGRNILTNLILDSLAHFLIDNLALGFSICSALLLIDRTTLIFKRGAALLPGVLCSLTVLPVLETTLFARDRFLNRSLGDLTLPLLNISTNGVGNIATLLLGDGLIRSLGNL